MNYEPSVPKSRKKVEVSRVVKSTTTKRTVGAKAYPGVCVCVGRDADFRTKWMRGLLQKTHHICP